MTGKGLKGLGGRQGPREREREGVGRKRKGQGAREPLTQPGRLSGRPPSFSHTSVPNRCSASTNRPSFLSRGAQTGRYIVRRRRGAGGKTRGVFAVRVSGKGEGGKRVWCRFSLWRGVREFSDLNNNTRV